MGKLTYTAIASLDGYVADADGDFRWAAPDEEVHAFANDLERHVETHLLGRRMYEVLVFWENPGDDIGPIMRDYANVWQAAQKVVYSRTLETVSSARTRLEREFNPEAVRALKASTDGELTIGGPELAAHALRAGLVDELHLITVPAVVGGGTSWLPDGLRLDLALIAQRRFSNGTVYAAYSVQR